MIRVAPSILSADFGKLDEEIKEVEPYADLLHIDVMDGHFVPNITIGPAVVKSIKSSLPLDCHLMISEPLKYAEAFAPYCERISFHAELFKPKALRKAVASIKKMGVKVGVALNPDKELNIIQHVLDDVDYVLIMSVQAGFAGQKFMPEVLQKIHLLRGKYNFTKDIEIDGGINKETVRLAKASGANIIVAGSYIFGAKDRKKAIQSLR